MLQNWVQEFAFFFCKKKKKKKTFKKNDVKIAIKDVKINNCLFFGK